MRVGQNPAKKANSVVKPERITVAVLNYIPFVSGFFAEMPDVLKVCLDSIRENTDLPFDLMVFDNGSCEEVVQYLVDEKDKGNIQYLLLSEKNLGKGGAWNIILSGAPGEIIAYSDNDIYYREGWLSAAVKILEAFPNVGMVTARPFRTDMGVCNSTLDWAKNTEGVTYEEGIFIPWEDYRDFNMSIGREEEKLKTLYSQSFDRKVSFLGNDVIIGASHWQFVSYKHTLSEFLPFDMDRPMGQVKHLDHLVDEKGYLRLMTTQPFAVNISNSLQNSPEIPSNILKTIHEVGASIKHSGGENSVFQKFRQISFIRKLMMKLYDSIFEWYFKKG